MFVLVDYNNSYRESIQECSKYKLTVVTMFRIILDNKNNIKTQLDKIKDLKIKLKPKFSAIHITIDKLENSTIGTINNLKQEFDLVIGLGGLNKINRFLIEDTQIDLLMDPQNSYFKTKIDFIHHLNSGMNQVLCKAAKEKRIGLFFSLNFTSGKPYNFAKEFGRINQNIKFARKYDLLVYLNFIIQNKYQVKTINQIKTISKLFDISTSQTKQITTIIEEKITKNKLKKSQKYVSEGITLV